jgi:nucleotide-binding universal stress UspA family protein
MSKSSEFSLKTIMVATDLSPASYGAMKYARDLARRFSAKLLLTHVIDPGSPGASDESNLCDKIDCAEKELQTKLESLEEDAIEGRVIVREGNIVDTISHLVDERRVDLLVLGTRGQTSRQGSALGSVAESLLRAMPCPVLTVAAQDRMDAFDGMHPTKIMVTTDFTAPSKAALEFAEHLAGCLNGQLHLLHVEDRRATSGVLSVSEQRAKFEALTAGMKEPFRIREHIMCIGDPADRIVRAVADRGVDLLIMSAHKCDHSGGRRKHGIVFDVIRQVRCPVFSLRVPVTRNAQPEHYADGRLSVSRLTDDSTGPGITPGVLMKLDAVRTRS